MYGVAAFLVEKAWDSPRDLADGVGVLLLTWNQAHYRHGPPVFARFEKFRACESAVLHKLRGRDIATLAETDDGIVHPLFTSGLDALQIPEGTCKGRRNPVAVAKALHILAPHFFPLWDAVIANAYDCYYAKAAGRRYIKFKRLETDPVGELREPIEGLLAGKTALKVLDEYSYARFTKEWV